MPKAGSYFGAVPQNFIYEKLWILYFKKDKPLLTKLVLSHGHPGGRLNIEKQPQEEGFPWTKKRLILEY